MSTTLSPEYHQFTLESLAKAGSDRAQFELWCEDNAPRALGGSQSYDDLLDRLDGQTWRIARDQRFIDQRVVDLPSSISDPVWRKLRSILATVLRESVA